MFTIVSTRILRLLTAFGDLEPLRVIQQLPLVLDALEGSFSQVDDQATVALVGGLLVVIAGRLGVGDDTNVKRMTADVLRGCPRQPAWKALVRSAADQCLAASLGHRLAQSSTGSREVDHALRLIALRYHEPAFRIADAARALGRSQWHLARLMMRHTGLAFAEHVKRHRVGVARSLLQAPSCSVKEVAARAGFRTASQLCRDFRVVYGMTPTEYRRRDKDTVVRVIGDAIHSRAQQDSVPVSARRA